jgi:hypothetical protein
MSMAVCTVTMMGFWSTGRLAALLVTHALLGSDRLNVRNIDHSAMKIKRRRKMCSG